MTTNRRSSWRNAVVRSTWREVRHAFDHLEGIRQRQTFKQAEPFARVSVPGQIEAIPADVFEAGKGRFEFRRIGTGIIGAVTRDEPVLIAVPLAVDVAWADALREGIEGSARG